MTSAKVVQLAVVHYVDAVGINHTQLAVIGDNTVLLASGKEFGFSGTKTEPSGVATGWLRDGILGALTAGEPRSTEEK